MRLIDADKLIEDEVWVEIEGFPNYEVSNMGNVRNAKTKKIRVVHPKGKYGHAQISLYKDGKNKRFQLHRLVALHFIPNPENKPEVCHIDNSLNEKGLLDNSVSNLMWGTHKENCEFWNTRKRQSENHANYKGENNPNYGNHLSKENKDKMMKERGKQVLQWENGRVIAFYESLREAGRKTGISWESIRNVCKKEYKHAGGYEWSYVCKPYDVDKVIEQLEESHFHTESTFDDDGWCNDDSEEVVNLNEAIEIVKRGGMDE